MPKSMKVSLIISTYNWPAALNICLQSILFQTRLPDEVLIADDGSGPETRELVESFKSHFPVPIVHVWHPDAGFQLAGIRNKAILVAKHEYIIQIDGDLILHPQFINDHLKLARRGSFISGSRVLLPADFTAQILQTGKIPAWLKLYSKGENRLNALRIPTLMRLLASEYKKNQPFYVKGCNMSFWRDDLVAINGYNEAITGWGREDNELAVRLINSGKKRLFIKFGGICYHLFHPVVSREMEVLNDQILSDAIKNKSIIASKGISAHTGYTSL
jgi:glycosyltransferase involved in cell wall biosynthesis